MIDTSFLSFLITEKTHQLEVTPIQNSEIIRAEIRQCRRLLEEIEIYQVIPEPKIEECAWCGDPILPAESTAKDSDGDLCHAVCVQEAL